MKILSTNHNEPYNNSPSFKAYYRSVLNKDGQLLYRSTTMPYRNDLDWDKFVRLLHMRYENYDKVDIINYACSIGTESFCLVAKLIKVLKDKSKKFFPIIAKDIDKENIKIAKSNKLVDDIYGLIDMKYGLGEDYTEYFDTKRLSSVSPNTYLDEVEIVPKEFLRNKVKFEQADILKDIDKMPKSNTVIMCRNFWPYLEPKQREELAKKLATNFDNTCYFVVGNFDHEQRKFKNLENVNDKDYPDICDIKEIFMRNGLKEAIKNVWYKPKK